MIEWRNVDVVIVNNVVVVMEKGLTDKGPCYWG